jgi:hypothetical protein
MGGALRHFVPAIIIAIAMFFASNISSKAQCPGSASPYSHTITIGSCVFVVDICVDCSPAFMTSATFMGYTYDDSNSACAPPHNALISQLFNDISDPNLYWNVFCQGAWGLNPCDDPPNFPQSSYNQYKITVPICFFYKRLDEDYIDIRACEDSPYCVINYQSCFDSSVPPSGIFHRYQESIDGPFGTVECAESVDPPAENDYDPTACFILPGTPCPIE